METEIMILCFLSFCLFRLAKADIAVQAPSNNPLAMTDDLRLEWSWDVNDFTESMVQLYRENQLICVSKLRKNRKIRFGCDCLPAAGNYSVRLENSTSNLIDFMVLWPEFELILPSASNTLNGTVLAKIKTHRPLCTPNIVPFTSSLKVQRQIESDALENNEFATVSSLDVTELWNADSVLIPCSALERAAVYKVALVIHHATDGGQIIALSNAMKVYWFEDYELQMTDSIYPHCKVEIVISFRRPHCPVSNDLVRLYGIQRLNRNTVSAPSVLKYLGEKRIYTDTKSVTFSCSRFDLIYIGFCFKLITVLSDGLVHNHATQCVPAEIRENTQLIDGAWSDWQSWGQCSVSCGKGLRQRKRLCDKPTPINGGAFCSGSAVQNKPCHQGECPNTTESASVSISGPCRCGCNLTRGGVLVAASGLCPNSNSTWIIMAPEDRERNHVSMKIIRLNLAPRDVLRIRDGLTNNDRLLFDAAVTEDWSKTFSSSARAVRVEFYTTNLTRFQRSIPNSRPEWQGAVIEFDFYDPTVSILPTADPQLDIWQYVTRRNLIVLASGAFAVIVLCLLGAGLWWHTKRKMDANFLLLSSQSMDASHHSALCTHSGKTNQAAMFSPIQELPPDPMHVSMSIEKPFRLPEIPEEMQVSTATQSTRISGISQKSVDSSYLSASQQPKKRSIGIQLSACSPAPSLRHQVTFGSRTNMGTPSLNHQTPLAAFDSQLSLAGTEQDFEYDYYEPALPGSYLTPVGDCWLESEIDIDQIIGDSELMCKTPSRSVEELEQCSVSTQIVADSAT